MKVITQELWPAHWLTYFIVDEWKPIYRWFNLVFARADWIQEYIIIDRDFHQMTGL